MHQIDVATLKANPYVVYELYDQQGTLQYIGHCKYTSLSAIPDAQKNPLFGDVFPVGSTITVKVVGYFQEKHDGRNYIWAQMKANDMPFMMKYGARIKREKGVICQETGQTYHTVTEAARDAGVTQGYMSKHLHRHPDATTVRGYTYSYHKVGVNK